MFIDEAKITLISGNGGDGAVSFHRAKYVPNGGPDGGDGGRGGSIIFIGDEGQNTLQKFRYKRKFKADDGQPGRASKEYGRSGENLEIKVPLGTQVINIETGALIADISQKDERIVIAQGGKGGQGNVHFANSVRQAPQFARAGKEGETIEVKLELKLLADVGLVGFPNAGKSTLLSVVTAAKPKIANYPFTTLQPNLGVVSLDDASFVMADVPGLIEGASEGAGLGLDFLRHIERTKLIVHVLDGSGSDGRDPLEAYDAIQMELVKYQDRLEERCEFVALNKIDLMTEEDIKQVKEALEKKGVEVFPMSTAMNKGVQALIHKIFQRLPEISEVILTNQQEASPDVKVYQFEPVKLFTIEKVAEGEYEVIGEWVRSIVKMTNFESYEALQYFQRLIRRKGVIDELIKAGIKEHDFVTMGDFSFEYLP